MEKPGSIFEKNYRDYLGQVGRLDFSFLAGNLGASTEKHEMVVPFFGRPHRISADAVLGPDGKKPDYSICVVLCKYLLMCPEPAPREADWVSYKDFKDAAPFVGGFTNNTERAIARHFSGRLPALDDACRELGGQPCVSELAYDLKMIFYSLPKIPLFLLFNDADEEFPARCAVLFEKRAEKYLDMECLAVLGWLLADYLDLAGGGAGKTMM